MFQSSARPTFTLWVLQERDEREVLLIVEYEDGTRPTPVLARRAADVRALLAEHGLPSHLTASSWAAIRFVRRAEPPLLRVSADVLSPKDLATFALTLVFAQYKA